MQSAPGCCRHRRVRGISDYDGLEFISYADTCKAAAVIRRNRAPAKAEPKGDDELTQSDYETLAAFRFALRCFANFSADAAQEAGLSPHQHQALLAIKGAPADTRATVGHLAEQLLIAPNTAAEFVARLESAGLVAKIVDLNDRRRVVLELTPKAETYLRRLTLSHRSEVRGLAPRLLALFRDLDAPGLTETRAKSP